MSLFSFLSFNGLSFSFFIASIRCFRYSVTAKDFYDNYGRGLLVEYEHSIPVLMMEVYPEAPWEPWRFSSVTKGFWDKKENRKKYLIWLGKRLEFKSMDDWYGLKQDQLKNNSGGGLSTLFNNSIPDLVTSTFDDYPWHNFLFKRIKTFTAEDIRGAVKFVEEQRKINRPEDWFMVTSERLKELGVERIFDLEGGLVSVLNRIRPGPKWEAIIPGKDGAY